MNSIEANRSTSAQTLYSRQLRSAVKTYQLREREEGYLLTARLPGVRNNELDVVVSAHDILILDKRGPLRKAQPSGVSLDHRSPQPFERSFALPDRADPKKVDARFDSGHLRIEFPKLECA